MSLYIKRKRQATTTLSPIALLNRKRRDKGLKGKLVNKKNGKRKGLSKMKRFLIPRLLSTHSLSYNRSSQH
jgi:hypothetical protein